MGRKIEDIITKKMLKNCFVMLIIKAEQNEYIYQKGDEESMGQKAIKIALKIS